MLLSCCFLNVSGCLLTEVETQYMVEGGIPKKASSTHQQAAADVKKAAG
jgi:hypothetical protein